MGLGTTAVGMAPAPLSGCRLVVRRQEALVDVLQFVIEGLEVGQQVVVLAAPACLKHLARTLGEHGLRSDAMLHNGRLVFLTAPDCLSQLSKLDDPLKRGPLRRTAPLMRWVSDWSWAYGNGTDQRKVLEYQRRVHDFVRSVAGLSMCTVHGQQIERGSLLAVLADHRRVAREPAGHA